MPELEIAVLGPLRVTRVDAEIVVPRGRVSALLADLAANAGRTLSMDRLLDDIYGVDLPERPRDALYVLVTRARNAIGAQHIVRDKAGYRLETDGLTVDAEVFTDQMSKALVLQEAGDQTEARIRLHGALELWRGPAFEGLSDYPFSQLEAARLDQSRLRAEERTVDLAIRLGLFDEATTKLRSLTQRDPTHEMFWFQLVSALYRAGQPDEALSAYQQARRALVDGLGMEPGARLRDLQARILGGAHVANPGRRPDNLPCELTTFIGRQGEVRRLTRLLDQFRLVTISGAAGTGKSRVARQVAAANSPRPGGIWLVELSALRDGNYVAQAVAQAMDLGSMEDVALRAGHKDRTVERHLIEHLREQQAMLILDNCEHLLDGTAAFIERLLASAPAVSVLCTTREPLGLPGEEIFVLHPLAVPPERLPEGGRLDDYESCKLFLDRLPRTVPDPRTEPAPTQAVVDICRSLDGIPLAIELAVARVEVLSAVELSQHLGSRLDLLASGSRAALPHHKTLRATLDWSFNQLDNRERRVLGELSLYPAGATLEAMVAQLPDLTTPDIVDLLSRLARKSLISAEASSAGTRYTQLSTIQTYALEWLECSGHLAAASRAQHAWCLRFATDHSPILLGPQLRAAKAALTGEHPNLVSAVRLATASGEWGAALELALQLTWYWRLSGLERLGFELLSELVCNDAPPHPQLAHAHMWASHLAWAAHDPAAAVNHASASMAHGGSAPDRALSAAFMGLAQLDLHLDQMGRAYLDDALAIALRDGDERTSGMCELSLAIAYISTGNLDAAKEKLANAHRHFQVCRDQWHEQRVLLRLMLVAEAQGDTSSADELAAELAKRSAELGLDQLEALAWAHRAQAAALTGAETADEYLAQADRLEQIRRGPEVTAVADSARAIRALLAGDHAQAHRWAREVIRWRRSIGGRQEIVFGLAILFGATEPSEVETRAAIALDSVVEAEQMGDTRATAIALQLALLSAQQVERELADDTAVVLRALHVELGAPTLPWFAHSTSGPDTSGDSGFVVAPTALAELLSTWRRKLADAANGCTDDGVPRSHPPRSLT